MWTYRTAAAALTAHAVNAAKPSASSGTAKTIVKERSGQRGSNRRLSAFYFAGMLFGGITFSRLSGTAGLFLQYEAASVAALYQSTGGVLFSNLFLATFVQMTSAVVLGLCAFGCPLILLLLIGKGAWSGCFYAWLYQTYRLKAAALSAGLFLPTQCLMDVLMLKLCSFALRCSVGLLRGTLGKQPILLRVQSTRLVRVYLVLTLCDLPLCLLSVALARVFGGMM